LDKHYVINQSIFVEPDFTLMDRVDSFQGGKNGKL